MQNTNRSSNFGLGVSVLVVLLFAVTVFSCAGGAPAGAVSFGDIRGREWILAEVKGASPVVLDRQKLGAGGLGDVYTIKFDAELVSGKGAPNLYRGPYTLGEGRALTIGSVAGTLMAAINEPEDLKESEYYAYLGGVSRWDLKKDRLELYSKDRSGAEAVLVFDPR
ncbi:MAG: META domain-containing protein [Treponema sp.]|jgi:heat shock protein HslJ|nr:META domain-containing protein [Treponema sp.]